MLRTILLASMACCCVVMACLVTGLSGCAGASGRPAVPNQVAAETSTAATLAPGMTGRIVENCFVVAAVCDSVGGCGGGRTVLLKPGDWVVSGAAHANPEPETSDTAEDLP